MASPFPPLKVPTVTLSLTEPPEITTTELPGDPFVIGHQRRLIVDLWENQPLEDPWKIPPTPDGQAECPPFVLPPFFGRTGFFKREDPDSDSVDAQEAIEPDSPNGILIQRLRDLVSAEDKVPPTGRIDMVQLGPEPWEEHILALDGLSPTHLKVFSHWDEMVDLDGFNKLTKPWTSLKSLHLIEETEGLIALRTREIEYNYDYPKFFTNLKSLILEDCTSFSFQARYLPINLTHLQVIRSFAMDTFVNACTRVPGFPSRLEVAYLSGTDPDCNEEKVQAFKTCLSECQVLKDLTLILGTILQPGFPPDAVVDKDIGFAPFIPKSVESLSFHCSTSSVMLDDLDNWIESARNPDWLPALKKITIRSDALDFADLELEEVEPNRLAVFDTKIQSIYKVLKIANPSVEIVP